MAYIENTQASQRGSSRRLILRRPRSFAVCEGTVRRGSKQLPLVLRHGPKKAFCFLFEPLRLSKGFSCGKMFNFVNFFRKLLNFFLLRMIRAINSVLNNNTMPVSDFSTLRGFWKTFFKFNLSIYRNILNQEFLAEIWRELWVEKVSELVSF